MKQKAMELKLVVHPIVGCLTHSHFWEGPCRAGHLEDMTPEAEKKAADAAFAAAKETLKQATDEIEFLPAVDARYDEKFVVGEDIFAQIEADMDKVDFFLCMNWRIPKLERYRKAVVILQNGNDGIDFAAYCRSIGVEAYVCMDIRDLNEIAHILWVRKAVANTRALVLTAGGQPTFGIQSLIRDPEILRQKYGFEVVKLPFNAIVPYMDAITDEEARPIAEKIISGANDVKVNTDWFIKGLGLQGIGRMITFNGKADTDVRRWQNSLTSYRDEKGEPYSPTYLKVINNQLVAIFNYAVKYYGLKENPCHKAGGMGKKKADEMLFWTKDEFNTFIEAVMDKPASYAIFMTLYYTGMREGELLALTPADIDFEKSTISINKSYQRIDGKDIVSTPKTPKSNRVITIPQGLKDCLKDYIAQCYGLKSDDRLFPYTKSYLTHEMERGCKLSGVKKIRIHDIRHSHASLLVEMGFSPLLIAERLGHERVQTTMETYSHLYPNKQIEVANRLDGVMG